MEITYPTRVRWHRATVPDPLQLYGTSNQKRLASTLRKMHELPIATKIEPLTQEFITWFQPLYAKTIGSKENARVHDVYDATLGDNDLEFEFFSQSLYEEDERVGATIFSLRTDMLAVHFRAYPQKWKHVATQANPSLLTDYYLAEHAYREKKQIFSHGQDRNPYGLNASIGLANFKLSVGCLPKLTKAPEFQTLDITTLTTDTLVFLRPEREQEEIRNALLVIERGTDSNYAQLLGNSEHLTFEVIYRD